MVQKVILDMDPGIDDALAIMMAVRSPELKIEAITTVGGNVHVSKSSKNALKIVENTPGMKCTPKVAKGLPKPLIRKELLTAEYIHGKDGLGDSNLPEPKLSLSKEHAVDLIIDKVLNSKNGKITLITTGPLSNVACALIKEPNITQNIAQIIMMGGAFGLTEYGFGNASPAAEFNVYSDPEAAKIVFQSEIAITAVGLDVTRNPCARITRREYDDIVLAKTESARLVIRITRNIMKRFGCLYLHDPLAVAVAVCPDLVCKRKYFVGIETKGEYTSGQTVVDRRKIPPPQIGRKGNLISVCTNVLGKKFIDLFMERVIFQDT